MSLTDFLFNGSPPQSVTNYGTSTSSQPQYMQDYLQALVAKANAVAAEPYQSFPGQQVAGFSPDQSQAQSLTRQQVGAYQPLLNQASQYTNQGATNPNLGTANSYLTQAAGINPLSTAQPYLNQATNALGQGSKSFNDPSTVQSYMNPYSQNVTDRATSLAQRSWNENILPSLQDTFTSAGQYGSSRMQQQAQNAGRDLTENLQQANNANLAQGYSQGSQNFQADQARQQQSASTYGALGQTAGGLGYEQGNLLGTLGNTSGYLGGLQSSNLLSAGNQLGNLASTGQNLGLGGIAALAGSGADQQALAQGNINTAMTNFQNQTQYPRNTVSWMQSVLQGLPQQSSTQSAGTGYAPAYAASGLNQLGSLISTLYGTSKAAGS